MWRHAGLRLWLSVAVEHCHDAWALVIEHASGWSLVYSGDTRPCKALTAAGHGCTILIHEATFEPDLINQARGYQIIIPAVVHWLSSAALTNSHLSADSDHYPRFLSRCLPCACQASCVSAMRNAQAVKKRHSTTHEALQVGKEMAASCTILTHFSSRYPKVDLLARLDRYCVHAHYQQRAHIAGPCLLV